MGKSFRVFSSSKYVVDRAIRHLLVDMGGRCWLVERMDFGYANQWKDGSQVSIPYASDGRLDWNAVHVVESSVLGVNMPDALAEKIWEGMTFGDMQKSGVQRGD